MMKATARIAAVELKGFRSVQTLAKIQLADANLTGIVGPNGSGKSTLLLALCFCLGSPLNRLGVNNLAELRCTDSSQACQVTVWVEDAQGKKRASHSICATLKPDGSREYRLDSRVKSGKDVKAFLRCRGLALDGCSVVKQAQITHLADTNNSRALLQVVEDASGYSRWQDETAAAHRELSGTRKALGDISNNITHLEEAAARNTEKLAALGTIVKLDRQIYEAQGAMAELLATLDSSCSIELEGLGARHSMLKVGGITRAMLQKKLEQQEEELRKLSIHIEQEQPSAAELPDLGWLQAQQQMASLEEEVRLLKERMQQPEQVLKQLDEVGATIQQLNVQGASSAKLAEQLVPHISHLEQLVVAPDARSSAVDMAAELSAQRAEIAQRKEHMQMCTEQLTEASQAAADSAVITQRLDQQETELARRAVQASAALPGIQASLEQTQAQAAACTQKAEGLRQLRQRLQVSLGMLAGQTAPPQHRMLHECFTIRSPASFDKDLLRPLDVILGNKTSIAIVKTTQAANALLAWRISNQQAMDRPLRIWPAENLRHKDFTAQQRQACVAFAAGTVIQPLDLLAFHNTDQAIMERAVGGMLIAADADTAAELATRHGLASVTLDGRISRPGSLQGGWQGSMPRSQAAHTLFEASRIQAEEAAVRRQFEALDSQAAALQQQQMQLQEDIDAHLALGLSVQQARQDAEALASQAQAAQAVLAASQADVEQGCNNLKHLEQLRRMFEGADGNGVDMAKQLIELRAKLAGHQAVADRCQQQLEEKESLVLELEEKLSMLDRPALENNLQQARSDLQTCREKLQALQAEAAAQKEQHQQQRKQFQMLQETKLQAQEACKRTQATIEAAVDAVAKVQKQQMWLQQEICQLGFKVTPDQHSRAVQGSAAEDLSLYKKQKAKLKSLQAERRACMADSISEAEQALHAERVRKLAGFKEQAQCMRQAVELVEQGMAAVTLQVERTKKAIFSSMAANFRALSKGLIQAVELRLSWVGEGVQFQWRYRSDEGSSNSWQADLAQLSGGQRSLVAIALLVAAAKAGSRSRLFLLDEVDAALDESKQAEVASLMRQLCSQQSGCQCLAVTHSAAFQAKCDALVQVSRGDGGTTFSAAGSRTTTARKRSRR